MRLALLGQASVKGKLMKVGKVGSIYSTKCLFSNIDEFVSVKRWVALSFSG